jgi:hypothetical protein
MLLEVYADVNSCPLTVADATRAIGDLLNSVETLAFTAQPEYRNGEIFFPLDSVSGNPNPVRIRPSSNATADPILNFIVRDAANPSRPDRLFKVNPANDLVCPLSRPVLNLAQVSEVTAVVNPQSVANSLNLAPVGIAAVNSAMARLNRFNDLIENNNGDDRFTPKALEAAPSGGGGSGLTAEQIWTHEPRTITARPPNTASDADAGAIKAKTDNLPSFPASTADVQVTVSGGFTGADRDALEAIPTLSEIEASTVLAKSSQIPPAPNNDGIAAIKAKTDVIVVTSGRVEAAIDDTLLAKEATVETVSTRTARVDALIESSGGGDRFTTKALEAAPTGESGSGLTAEQVWSYEPRTITARPPGTASDTVVAGIKAKTDNLPASPASTDDVQVQVTVNGGFTSEDRTTLEALPVLSEIEASTTLAKSNQIPPAPDNQGIADIRAKTNTIIVSNGRVQAAIDTSALAKEETVQAIPSADENAAAVRTNLGAELGRIDAPISETATPDDVQVQVTVDGGFTTGDRAALQELPSLPEIEASTTLAKSSQIPPAPNNSAIVETRDKVRKLFNRQGLQTGITATQLDPSEAADGYLTTSDGQVNQTITKNDDGSITISTP